MVKGFAMANVYSSELQFGFKAKSSTNVKLLFTRNSRL